MAEFSKIFKNLLGLSKLSPTAFPKTLPKAKAKAGLRLVAAEDQEPTQNFDAIVVRIELNGHTQVFLEKKSELVCPLLNEYFSRAHDIIQRYGGVSHQQIGDEIIFYFKDESPGTAALALSCIRTLVELAQRIEQSLEKTDEPYFKVKACMAPGVLHILPLASGTALTGLPFIETANLLSHFDDRSKNLVCFYGKSHHGFSFLCDVENFKESVLRNFREPATVARVTQFRDQQSFVSRKNFQSASYFRGDRDVQTMVEYFTEHLSFESEENFVQAFKFIRSLHFKTATPELVDSVTALLKTALQRNQQNWVSDRALASAISLVKHIVPYTMVTAELVEVLCEGLEHADPRICANAIAALGELQENSVYLKNYIHSNNNRVSSEALLAAGKENLTPELIEKIEKQFQSKNPLHQASAAYVSQSLVEHYRNLDEEFYRNSSELRSLESFSRAPVKKAA